jgi:hypothetical protein
MIGAMVRVSMSVGEAGVALAVAFAAGVLAGLVIRRRR